MIHQRRPKIKSQGLPRGDQEILEVDSKEYSPRKKSKSTKDTGLGVHMRGKRKRVKQRGGKNKCG